MSESLNNKTKVAVWDTYVKKKDGNFMHFDIIVPENLTDKAKIFGHGKTFADSQGASEANIDSSICQFCHLDNINAEMEEFISKQGYYILEMDEIPAQLPINPCKRDLILYLKAHISAYRFISFRGLDMEEIKKMVSTAKID